MRLRPPKLRGQPRPPIASVRDWLKKPDLFVTRRELWYLIAHYDRALKTERRERAWHRVLLRRLLTPLFTRPGRPATRAASGKDGA